LKHPSPLEIVQIRRELRRSESGCLCEAVDWVRRRPARHNERGDALFQLEPREQGVVFTAPGFRGIRLVRLDVGSAPVVFLTNQPAIPDPAVELA
jgi:hypothetical protein